jgi:SAM-dependent methyltransferase
MSWLRKNDLDILKMIFQKQETLSAQDINNIKENFIIYSGRGNEKFIPAVKDNILALNEEISYRNQMTENDSFKIQQTIKECIPQCYLSERNYTKQFSSLDGGILRVIIKIGEIPFSKKDKIAKEIISKLKNTKDFFNILLEFDGSYISFSFNDKSFAIIDLLKNNPDMKIIYYGDSPLGNDKPIFYLSKGSLKNKLEFVHVENPIHTLSLIKTYHKEITKNNNFLTILQDKEAIKNIEERLKEYWKTMNLPYSWIPKIIKILSGNVYDENLAVSKIRKEFPNLTNKNSKNYSEKLKQFRKKKVMNLSKRIGKTISGDSIADIGGRADDFMEQILKENKDIKRAYVTDIGTFSERSKNPRINFVVQPSLNKTPFQKESVDNVILSLILHHMEEDDQKLLIQHLATILKKKGRLILIEDSYPENCGGNNLSENIKKFLSFDKETKMKILSFYDWFGNKIMRNRDNIALTFNYKTMEKWRNLFEREGLKIIHSEFIGKSPENLDLFPPKVFMIFEKMGGVKR